MDESEIRQILDLRLRAPRVFAQSLLMHYSSRGVLPAGAKKITKTLEAMVRAKPDHAAMVIKAFEKMEYAGGSNYDKIISILRSMLARDVARKAMAEIEKGMK